MSSSFMHAETPPPTPLNTYVMSLMTNNNNNNNFNTFRPISSLNIKLDDIHNHGVSTHNMSSNNNTSQNNISQTNRTPTSKSSPVTPIMNNLLNKRTANVKYNNNYNKYRTKNKRDRNVKNNDINSQILMSTNLLIGDVILAGTIVGIVKYLGPIYLDKTNIKRTTKEYYVGLQCMNQNPTNLYPCHNGYYKHYRYFKTDQNKKTGILIPFTKFTNKVLPSQLLKLIHKQYQMTNDIVNENKLLRLNIKLLLQNHLNRGYGNHTNHNNSFDHGNIIDDNITEQTDDINTNSNINIDNNSDDGNADNNDHITREQNVDDNNNNINDNQNHVNSNINSNHIINGQHYPQHSYFQHNKYHQQTPPPINTMMGSAGFNYTHHIPQQRPIFITTPPIGHNQAMTIHPPPQQFVYYPQIPNIINSQVRKFKSSNTHNVHLGHLTSPIPESPNCDTTSSDTSPKEATQNKKRRPFKISAVDESKAEKIISYDKHTTKSVSSPRLEPLKLRTNMSMTVNIGNDKDITNDDDDDDIGMHYHDDLSDTPYYDDTFDNKEHGNEIRPFGAYKGTKSK